MRQNTFGQSARRTCARGSRSSARRPFELPLPAGARCRCSAALERFPYVPADAAHRDERCAEVYNIQVQALLQRLQRRRHQKVVIGISGGLDSTHALLVCAKAMDRARACRAANILAYTMPGFATSDAHAASRRSG